MESAASKPPPRENKANKKFVQGVQEDLNVIYENEHFKPLINMDPLEFKESPEHKKAKKSTSRPSVVITQDRRLRMF